MPAHDRREIVVAFRLTAAERAHLVAAGQALRIPRSLADYCRAAALHVAHRRVPAPSKPIRRRARRLPAADTQSLAKLLAAVGQIGDRVKPLAGIATSTGTLPSTGALADIAAALTDIRARLITVLRGGKLDDVP